MGFRTTINDHTILGTDLVIKIKDSYTVTDLDTMQDMLVTIRSYAESRGFTYTRSNKSWLQEWQAHNFLANCNYKFSQTSSVDLNENESIKRLFGYVILSFIYKVPLLNTIISKLITKFFKKKG